jgi:hypothetical protein
MATFSIDKSPEPTQSLNQAFKNLTLSGVAISSTSPKFVKINCQTNGATVTYTKSNVVTSYKASQLGIYGKIHDIDGVSYDGEMIFKNDPMTNAGVNMPIYMCFLLSSNSSNAVSEIDFAFSPSTSTSLPVINLSTDNNGAQYILYKTTNLNGAPCLVAIYTTPIHIKSSLTGYSTTTEWFSASPSTSVTDYVIIKNESDGDWMECDYVPVDSETVTTYNLPIQSSIIKDSNALDSLRMTIMFVVFFLVCVFAYFLIPVIYVAIAGYVLRSKIAASGTAALGTAALGTAASGRSASGRAASGTAPSRSASDLKKTILYMDYVLSFLLGGAGFILICVGAFSDPNVVKNTGDLLLSGFSLAIIYIISYIVIQSKKLSSPNFINGVNYIGGTDASK